MSGADWLEKDFYQILGVKSDATDDEIRKAYRKLARKLHPDQNPGDKSAEEKFKAVGEAYGVLKDPKQRKQYDAIRSMAAGGARFQAGPGGAGGGFEDILSSMFGAGAAGAGTGGSRLNDFLSMFRGGSAPAGSYSPGSTFGGFPGGESFGSTGFSGGFPGNGFPGQASTAPVRGADLLANTSLTFKQAINGATVRLSVDGKKLTVKIPAGVHDGQKLKLRGKGRPSTTGGPAGDLVLKIVVQADPVWRLDGANLRRTLPVTVVEAALGTKVEVELPDGSTVKVTVPAGTSSGAVLRVKKRGIETKGKRSDVLLEVRVQLPKKLSRDAKAALEQFAAATADFDPRAA